MRGQAVGELLELRGDHDDRGLAQPLDFDGVVDTPRRARSSVGHCADDEVGFSKKLIEHRLGRGRAGIIFSQRHDRCDRDKLAHALHHERKQVVGIALGVVERTQTDTASRLDVTLLARTCELVQRGFRRNQENFLAHRELLSR